MTRTALALGTAVVTATSGLLVLPGPAAAAPERAAQRAETTKHRSAPGELRLQTAQDGIRSGEFTLGRAELGRTLEADRFTMAALTWTGSLGTAEVRVRDKSGAWGRWQHLERLGDGPDADDARTTRRGTDLTWMGKSDAVRVRVAGKRPADLRLVLMNTPRDLAPQADARKAKAKKNPLKPPLQNRKRWGADERLRDGKPIINRTIQQVHVHHTVNSNSYSLGDVPGMIRGIYRYHTKSLGWSDIGYNFLVDKWGRTWVGRAGGPSKPVRGAHTLGFNSTSTGIAVIGNFENRKPSNKMITGVVKLAAWKLDKYGRKPRGKLKIFSHGSDKYPYGTTVRLPVIDGHRDTNDTSCPGIRMYKKLPTIRQRTAERIARLG